MRRLLYLLPLVLFFVVAAHFGVRLVQVEDRPPNELPSALIDKPAPDFALLPLKEDKPGLATADLRGEVRLVNVFASWCGPCRVEHPLLMRLSEEGVPVVAINYKDKPEDAKAWLARFGDPYRAIGVDPTGRTAIDWGVYGVPETFVVDKEGRIRLRHVGPIMPRDLEETIMPLIRSLRG